MIPEAARPAASVVMLRPAPPPPSPEPTTSPRRPARLRAFLATVAMLGLAVDAYVESTEQELRSLRGKLHTVLHGG